MNEVFDGYYGSESFRSACIALFHFHFFVIRAVLVSWTFITLAVAAMQSVSNFQYLIMKIFFTGKLEDASCALNEVSPDLLSYPAILQLRVALLLATNQQNVFQS